jgi:hypothetical protein
VATRESTIIREVAQPVDGPALQWHPDAHHAWAGEQLYFVRLAFSPVYRRARIRTGIEKVLAEHAIRSFVAYEVLGLHDVILRLWLPNSTTHQAFLGSLRTELRTVHLNSSDVFVSLRQERNWLWETGNGVLVTPDPERLQEGPPTVAELQSLYADENLLNELEAANLVRVLPKNEGVKFFMVLPAPQQLSDESLEAVYTQVGEALDQAELSEYSLYVGQGFASAAALVVGRIPFERFHDIGDRLSGEILRRLTDTLSVRTYTFPVSSETFLCYGEEVPGTETSIEANLEAPIELLLTERENRWAEIKASAYVPLDPLFKSGQWIDRPNTDPAKAFPRAVVSLLNTEGGTVVLGALEDDKYPEDDVREHFGDCPARGSYLCLGLDREIAEDQDAFELRLRNSLAARIRPDPVNRFEVEFANIDDRMLVMLRVKRCRDAWFYLDGNEFVIRDGNQSRTLEGHEMDRYRKTNPRKEV